MERCRASDNEEGIYLRGFQKCGIFYHYAMTEMCHKRRDFILFSWIHATLSIIVWTGNSHAQTPVFPLSNFQRWSREKLGLCLSLGDIAASIHVMNSTYFPKKWNYNNSEAFHVTNCSSEFLASCSPFLSPSLTLKLILTIRLMMDRKL